MKDFFVRYNSADRGWAEWIAWQLEKAGHSTVIQAWDFGAGGNFVLAMQKAASESERTLIVLSPDWLSASFTWPEFAAAFAQDPTGEKRLVLPVRVRACELDGLLKPIVYIDLVGVPEVEARERLLSGIAKPGTRPSTPPPFPGNPVSQPEFPAMDTGT
jgi:hypothetical protein